MKKISIITNRNKDKDYSATKIIAQMITDCKMIPVMSEEHRESGIVADYVDKTELANTDMIVVLGGDGTLLSAARDFCEYDVPILGINYGHLGFLTEIEKEDKQKFEEILMGKYIKSQHMTLCVDIDGKRMNALNDAVIHRGGFSRMLEFSIYIDDEFVNSASADGLIISTPTGSTAYSLSAGGPIVDPTVEVLLITPICPHNLSSRCIIVPAGKRIKIEIINAEEHETMLTLDGQIGYELGKDASIIFTGGKKINLVRINNSSFYKKLKDKMFE